MVTWTVGGVRGTPYAVTIPDDCQPHDLIFQGSFALGATLVTVNVAAGTLSLSCATTVEVVDPTPPNIAPPVNITAEATSAAGAVVSFSATATDLVDGVVAVNASPASGSMFALGTTTVTLTAKDARNNTATRTFTVTVNDPTPPVLTLPASLTVEATSAGGAVVTFAPTATDTVSTPTVTTSPGLGSVFPPGSTTVNVSARDAAGNVATGSFTVTVNDPYGVTLTNVAWPLAIDFDPRLVSSGGRLTGGMQQKIARAGESRWYKFLGKPGSRIDVTLTNLPANFDVVVYSDIRQAYNRLLGLIGSSVPADQSLRLQYGGPGCGSLLTEQPDWAQAFARKRAIWIAGTGCQYGDTDFVEYMERLLLAVARALRTGTGPVAVGRALVEAKRRYLADTAIMRGIHEKTLLELTLYGLPMVKFNLPGARLSPPAPTGDVAGVAPVATGPGAVHSLKQAELSVVPVLTQMYKTLDVVGSTATITASYFRGSDGIVSIPGEPVRPLESFNVSRPEGFVRGVGFRGGQYADVAGFVPFTGAPATETRGVHGSFSTEVFYPSRPWNLNQIGELGDANGISAFNVFPTQFISDGPDSATGTLRKFSGMQFTIFYCPANSSAALANPPAINVAASSVNGNVVTFSVDTAASARVGVQEVWVTYTGLAGSS